MPTRISFSRERIERNIPFSRDRIAGRRPATKPSPPIRVTDTKRDYWTFGLTLAGQADVIYEPRPLAGQPSLLIQTVSDVTETEITVDYPSKERGSRYIYIQLSWLRGNRKRTEGPHLPVLTRRRFHNARWISQCSYHLRIHGESVLEYSLGSPLDQKGGEKDGGVRLWLRTEAEVTPVDGDWYPATHRECIQALRA